jgi:hypothetical protein
VWADGLKIGAQQLGDRRWRARGQDARDPLSPLRGAPRLVARKIVSARPGVSVDKAEGRFLACQMNEDPRQNGVLEDVDEIAGMKCVAIVDLKRPPFRRGRSDWILIFAKRIIRKNARAGFSAHRRNHDR